MVRDDERDPSGGVASRRTLLKWSGMGTAAAIAAAGGATLGAPTAHAADGDSLLLGQQSAAEHETRLNYDGTELQPIGFTVSTAGVQGATAIRGLSGNTTDIGQIAIGLHGSAGTNSFGVKGEAIGADGSIGVLGIVTGGIGGRGAGVFGGGNADAVVGAGGRYDLSTAGTGRIFQTSAGHFSGPPPFGDHAIGEQIRDQTGELFICVLSGNPGTWKKVAALHTVYKGGAVGLLPTPIRAYDSRNTGGPLIGNATRDVIVANSLSDGVHVPQFATGVIGNLTVTGASAGGYLVIYPQGSSTPSTSTVNFLAGQTVANAFVVGVNGGKVTVHSFTSGRCHFILDVTAFTI